MNNQLPSHKALEIFASKGRTQALLYALHSGCLGEYRKLRQSIAIAKAKGEVK